MAVGHLPGLQVDRAGAAPVGALALVATGTIDPQGRWNAIDYRTIGLLFGLMIVSSAFAVSRFFAWAAAPRLTKADHGRSGQVAARAGAARRRPRGGFGARLDRLA
jgi:Na+/H+ antiporter NhaD/arsenite permease-like protein